MLDTFYRIYSKLIEKGYYLKQWRETISIILRKENTEKKRDYSKPKAYRVISLLNCLGKVAEKIIVTRLSYLIETIDLLFLE